MMNLPHERLHMRRDFPLTLAVEGSGVRSLSCLRRRDLGDLLRASGGISSAPRTPRACSARAHADDRGGHGRVRSVHAMATSPALRPWRCADVAHQFDQLEIAGELRLLERAARLRKSSCGKRGDALARHLAR